MRPPRSAACAALVIAAAALAACSPAPRPARTASVGQGNFIPGLESPSAGSASSAAATSAGASPTATGPKAGPATTPGAPTATSGGAPTTTAPTSAAATSTKGGRASSSSPTRKPTKAGSSPTKALGYTPLYTGASDTRGITADSINLCAHAALTYGAAFNTSASDFNVFWSALNDKGGIFGRKVTETYQNDNYDPTTAVQAATACAQTNPFMILGGIGFDQIPAVREWAEQNKELYLYHDATLNGEAGKKYSFTALPSVEQLGAEFGLLVHSRFQNQKIGIIYRDSPEWDPGRQAFLQLAKQYGFDKNIVDQEPVQTNQANYQQQVLNLKNAGAQVVWIWENGLAVTEIVQQAKTQVYSPQWLVFPFNVSSQTLGQQALQPPMLGIAAWPAYSKGDYSAADGFAPYADDMKLFEAQYAQYDPNADLSGLGGDLLFLNWEGQKGLAQLFTDCGKNCTRSAFAHMLESGYTYSDPDGCGVDFSRGDHHVGGYQVSLFQTFQAPDGKVDWHPLELCTTQVH